MSRARARIGHDGRALVLALLAGLPAVVAALWLLFTGGFDSKIEWTLTALITGSFVGFALAVRAHVARPLLTMANLLAALREGDFSIRGRLDTGEDALGAAVTEINSLGETLHARRLDAIESTALLRKVMEEIDVALLGFDDGARLRLVNRSGEKLLGKPAERLLGCTAERLGMDALLGGESPRTVELAFPGGQGAWELRRGSFRQGGLPHTLLVLTDLQRVLRQEERQAWQRLVRVLGHEINNSLAPIHSLADNLKDILVRQSSDWQANLERGLTIIARRSEALLRFMTAYARLARLPPPTFEPVDVAAWIRRVVELEKRLAVTLVAGPALVIDADPDQLDQVLINLVQNAVDAALETSGGVTVEWRQKGQELEVLVVDEGPGLAETGNLFVPFFTTKPQGSGIGLVLGRQIAEAHHGKLTLHGRTADQTLRKEGTPERIDNMTGCVARLVLPLGRSRGPSD